jgi:hypothetical protein
VTAGELVLAEGRNRHRDVLLLAAGIGEAEVDELDFGFLHHVHHVGDGLGHQYFSGNWVSCGRWGSGSGDWRECASPKTAHQNLAESMPVP